MKITSNYSQTGTSYESFEKEIDEFIQQTKKVVVHNSNLKLYSFKEVTKDGGFAFYEILEDYVNLFNNGSYKEFPIKIFKAKTPEEKALFEETAKSDKTGILLEYSNALFFIDDDSVISLAERAGLKGRKILKGSLARNLLIAEGLLYNEKSNKEEWASTIIYRCLKNGGNTLRKIFALRAEKFKVSTLVGIKNAVETACGDTPLGKGRVVKWKATNLDVSVFIEFPDAITEDNIIPGLLVIDSDIGFASLTCMPTFRFADMQFSGIVSGKSWQHGVELKKQSVDDYILKTLTKEVTALNKALAKKKNKKMTSKPANVFTLWSKELQICSAIGKKRFSEIEKNFKDSRFEIKNEFDLVKRIFEEIESVLLSKATNKDGVPAATLKKSLAVMGQLLFVSTKNIVIKIEEETT